MIIAMIGSFFLFVVALFGFTMSYPWHASCKIMWQIPTSCDDVRGRLINQMNEWDNENCPTTSPECPEMPCGQKCLYKYLETKPDGEVTGTHETPVARYVDNLFFKFAQSGDSKCDVEAFSTSDTWYAVLDFGTNYCNLRNLLDGTGISATDGFKEETSTSICTQYDTADCERY